jgi:hypothetical protein
VCCDRLKLGFVEEVNHELKAISGVVWWWQISIACPNFLEVLINEDCVACAILILGYLKVVEECNEALLHVQMAVRNVRR